MAITYGFYNSIGGDRTYDAEHFGKLFRGIINDGVFHNMGNDLSVSPNNTPELPGIKVADGRAWIADTWLENTADYLISLASPHQTLNRIDLIVLEANRNTRENTIKAITGTPAQNPTEPALTNNDSIKQIALAAVTVRNSSGSGAILSTDISDKRGTVACPWVAGPTIVVSRLNVDQALNNVFGSES